VADFILPSSAVHLSSTVKDYQNRSTFANVIKQKFTLFPVLEKKHGFRSVRSKHTCKNWQKHRLPSNQLELCTNYT